MIYAIVRLVYTWAEGIRDTRHARVSPRTHGFEEIKKNKEDATANRSESECDREIIVAYVRAREPKMH